MKRILVLIALCATPALAQQAQPATPVQQAATMLNAASLVSCASGTAQQTLTLTPPSGQYVYVLNVDIVSQATTAPAASALTHTSTNLGGMKWYGSLTATGGTVDKVAWIAAQPLKSATAGTAVTIVSNAAITSVTFNLCVTYYTAY
jgi:hypothetical protein